MAHSIIALLLCSTLLLACVPVTLAEVLEQKECRKAADCGTFNVLISCNTLIGKCSPYQQTKIACQTDQDCKGPMNGTIVTDDAVVQNKANATVECGNFETCQCRQHHGISKQNLHNCLKIMHPAVMKVSRSTFTPGELYAPVIIAAFIGVIVGDIVAVIAICCAKCCKRTRQQEK